MSQQDPLGVGKGASATCPAPAVTMPDLGQCLYLNCRKSRTYLAVVTSDGIVIDGCARREVARLQGRPTVEAPAVTKECGYPTPTILYVINDLPGQRGWSFWSSLSRLLRVRGIPCGPH